jgi:glycosyltransferase involved in cell wall biosynthesis
MKIAIATDAWLPQTNGVVTTLRQTARVLAELGHEVRFLTPEPFFTLPLPSYRSIRLAVRPGPGVAAWLDRFAPDAVHIATEGPLGWATRAYCHRRGLRFTTAYHTQFPQYLRARAPVPEGLSYRLLRRFHAPAVRTLVPTESVCRQLQARGFEHLAIWSRGVDTELFRPGDKGFLDYPRPIAAYVGRVAVEKNIEAFLSLELPGTQLVVGDGPDLEPLRQRYPLARFVGFRYGEELARYLAAANVFVFPSRTDTFGLVMLEAMACGVPVAAFPVTGPVDLIQPGRTGELDEDLGRAVRRALLLDPGPAREYALTHSWRAATEQFLSCLAKNAQGPASAAGGRRSMTSR